MAKHPEAHTGGLESKYSNRDAISAILNEKQSQGVFSNCKKIKFFFFDNH